MTSTTAAHKSTYAVVSMLLVLVVIAPVGAAPRGHDGKNYVSGGGADATIGNRPRQRRVVSHGVTSPATGKRPSLEAAESAQPLPSTVI